MIHCLFDCTVDTLLSLIAEYRRSEYKFDTYLSTFLREKIRQVNAISIFYTETVEKDEPQISVYSKATIPRTLVSHQTVLVLTLNVLPNSHSFWENWTRTQRPNKDSWYNNLETNGRIGRLWRHFRAFYRQNRLKVRQYNLFMTNQKTKN